jgi:hypothetical protein
VNPSRLAELNHQRALVREQLAWLEREIAKETAGLNPIAVVQTAAARDAVQSVQVRPELEAFQPDPTSAAINTRRGCFTAVAIVALILIAALTAIYFLRYGDRPLLFVAEESGTAHGNESAPPGQPEKQ